MTCQSVLKVFCMDLITWFALRINILTFKKKEMRYYKFKKEHSRCRIKRLFMKLIWKSYLVGIYNRINLQFYSLGLWWHSNAKSLEGGGANFKWKVYVLCCLEDTIQRSSFLYLWSNYIFDFHLLGFLKYVK